MEYTLPISFYEKYSYRNLNYLSLELFGMNDEILKTHDMWEKPTWI